MDLNDLFDDFDELDPDSELGAFGLQATQVSPGVFRRAARAVTLSARARPTRTRVTRRYARPARRQLAQWGRPSVRRRRRRSPLTRRRTSKRIRFGVGTAALMKRIQDARKKAALAAKLAARKAKKKKRRKPKRRSKARSRKSRRLKMLPISATCPAAYRALAAHSGVGGPAGMAMLEHIKRMVDLANTRQLATSEHNKINNTLAFRRAVLKGLRRNLRG